MRVCKESYKHTNILHVRVYMLIKRAHALRAFPTGPESFGSTSTKEKRNRGFPGGTVVKNPPANAGDMGSSPGPRRSHMLWSN